jgi:hypothetical protein
MPSSKHIRYLLVFIDTLTGYIKAFLTTNKRARAHCHTQAWAKYRELMKKYQKGHKEILLLGNQER